MHWRPKHNELKSIIPEIELGDAFSIAETFETYTDSFLILDDMMDYVVNDSGMMKILTERLKISVIFITQSIFI